jgi:hypothetical protein
MIGRHEFNFRYHDIQCRRSDSPASAGRHFGSIRRRFLPIRFTSNGGTREGPLFRYGSRRVGPLRIDGQPSQVEFWKITGSLHRLFFSDGPTCGMVAVQRSSHSEDSARWFFRCPGRCDHRLGTNLVTHISSASGDPHRNPRRAGRSAVQPGRLKARVCACVLR